MNFTSSNNEIFLKENYDYDGALYFLLFSLFWYSLFVIALLIIQTKKTEVDYFEDSDDPHEMTARSLLKTISSEDNIKREALEDLRDKSYRDKYWNVYLNNPKNYKLLQYEPKRIQQIDRKLKQYSSIQKNDHYKTIDSSLMSERSSRQKVDSHSSFLLRDVNKLDTSIKDSVFYNNSTLTSYRLERSNHALVKNIWNNNANNCNSSNRESPKNESVISNPVNNNVVKVSATSLNEKILSDDDQMKNFNTGRRFTIEKIKDIV